MPRFHTWEGLKSLRSFKGLSMEPIQGFRKLFTGLGLHFSERAEGTILRVTSSENPSDLRSVHSVQLDSRAALKDWQNRLTPAEIGRIRQRTHPVSDLYYTEEDWH